MSIRCGGRLPTKSTEKIRGAIVLCSSVMRNVSVIVKDVWIDIREYESRVMGLNANIAKSTICAGSPPKN